MLTRGRASFRGKGRSWVRMLPPGRTVGAGVTLNVPARLNVSKSAKHCDLDSISINEYPAIWAAHAQSSTRLYVPI
jgi:hypothetical protein